MIDRRIIVGILTMLVIFATVQGIRQVMAAEGTSSDSGPLSSNYENTVKITAGNYPRFYSDILYVGVEIGQGMVCWSGATNGCTQSVAAIWLHPGETLTVTAKGVDGSKLASWVTIDLSSEGASGTYIVTPTNPEFMNPDTAITYASIQASFTSA
jgi:hypothetical protein